jgi:putative transposase
MLRTGRYTIPANAGKLQKVNVLFGAYRCTAKTLACAHWKHFFSTGRLDRNRKTGVHSLLSARYVQTCQYQVVAVLRGFLANCAEVFKGHVLASSLPEHTRIALLYLNKYSSWYRPEVRMQGERIDAATLRLARNIFRHVLNEHRKPNMSRINLALDEKVAVVTEEGAAKRYRRWLRLSTHEIGKPILLPIADNAWFDALEGTRQKFVQVNRDEHGTISVGLIKDVPPTPYQARLPILGIDVGLKNLIATSEGDLLGRHLMPRLVRLDDQISSLAANRQGMGLRVRSRRYDGLVQRMRSLLKNEIHRTLRVALLRHKPAQVAIEALDFRSPRLSKRMNRLVQNFGRSEFARALEPFGAQYGFTVTPVEAAYSSQTCHPCGYVDKRNRRADTFKCLHCGHSVQADIHASRNLAARLEEHLGGSEDWAGRRYRHQAILERTVRRFATAKRLALIQQRLPEAQALRRRRRDSTPCLSMLSNPYFATVLAPLHQAVRVAQAA